MSSRCSQFAVTLRQSLPSCDFRLSGDLINTASPTDPLAVRDHCYQEAITPGARRSAREFESGRDAPVYHLKTDPNDFDRATEIRLFSFARPHMRLFQMSWISALFGFLGWYSIPPLMPVIKEQLRLTESQVLNSDIASTASTIITRIAIGPVLDRFGPRLVQCLLLLAGAIPVASAAFVSTSTELLIVRFCIGFVGCIFVSNQYWTTISFSKNVVGTGNAIVGGLAVSGVGFAFLVLPFINIALGKAGLSQDLGWRVTIAIPALLMVLVAIMTRYCSDACPMGDFSLFQAARKTAIRGHAHENVGLLAAYKICLEDKNTLILILNYAVCFGAELQLNNMGALYFYEEFLRDSCDPSAVPIDLESCQILTKTEAAIVASFFGLMNIFSRPCGGIISDRINSRFGMNGRLYAQIIFLVIEGLLVLILSRMHSLGICIALYIMTGISAQAAGGSTFSISPYLNEAFAGVVAGLIGAGGNVGGVLFGFLFLLVGNRKDGLFYMSFIIFISATCTLAMSFKGEKDALARDQRDHVLSSEE